MNVAVLFAFLSLLYEFPLSVLVEIQASFGKIDSGAFIQYRLKFAAVVILICSLNVLVNLRGILKTHYFWVYFGVLLHMMLVVGWYRNEYAWTNFVDDQSISAVGYWAPIFFKYILFFLIGLHITYFYAYRYLLLVFLIAASAAVLQYVDFETLGIDRRNYVAGANQGNYLFLADALAISSLLLVALFKRSHIRLVLFIVSALVLFLVGSRTSFVVFTFSILLYYLWTFRIKWVPLYIVIFFAAFAFISTLDLSELESRNSRMIGIFIDLDEDNSVVARKRFSELGWEDIKNSPVTGRFGGQRDSDLFGYRANWNSYMHDVFSYWRQFGFIVFAGIIYLYIRFGLRMLSENANRNSMQYRVLFTVNAFLVVESVISRSFAFSATHLFFGLAIAFLAREQIVMTLRRASEDDDQFFVRSLTKESDTTKSKKRRRKRRKSLGKRIRF